MTENISPDYNKRLLLYYMILLNSPQTLLYFLSFKLQNAFLIWSIETTNEWGSFIRVTFFLPFSNWQHRLVTQIQSRFFGFVNQCGKKWSFFAQTKSKTIILHFEWIWRVYLSRDECTTSKECRNWLLHLFIIRSSLS